MCQCHTVHMISALFHICLIFVFHIELPYCLIFASQSELWQPPRHSPIPPTMDAGDCLVSRDADVGDMVSSEPENTDVCHMIHDQRTMMLKRKFNPSICLTLCDAKQPCPSMFGINFSVVRRTYRSFNQTNHTI